MMRRKVLPSSRFVLCLGTALVLNLAPAISTAERARNPASSTAFIRVIGKLRIEYQDVWDKSIEEKDVELGTGTGFVISPYGHVLTNYHVISDDEIFRNLKGTDFELQMTVEKIKVVFPSLGPEDSTPVEFLASIDAVDPELDLAILTITGVDLPYIPFGDSDAVSRAQPVRVFGFPLGRKVEVGRASVPDIVPKVSVSSGAISARRGGRQGSPHLLQTTATVNPGNSGGPMVDQEGFVQGVIRLKLADADGIGFAIPINEVKDFLESHGFDQLLPIRRLRIGPLQTLPDKGLSVRLPLGQDDLSGSRVRVDTGRETEPAALIVDRVATPWSLDELEHVLRSGRVFERFASSSGTQESARSEGGRGLLGRTVGTIEGDTASYIMEYAILDLGGEKLIARFLGPDEAIAFNASVIRRSLTSLSAEPMLTAAIKQELELEWTRAPLPSPRAPHLMMPAGWLREDGAPAPCPELMAPESAILASPAGDYTVAFLAAWWAEEIDPLQAAQMCSKRQGSLGPRSYSSVIEYLGISYQIEGMYLEHSGGILRLELVSPLDKYGFVAPAFKEWTNQNRDN